MPKLSNGPKEIPVQFQVSRVKMHLPKNLHGYYDPMNFKLQTYIYKEMIVPHGNLLTGGEMRKILAKATSIPEKYWDILYVDAEKGHYNDELIDWKKVLKEGINMDDSYVVRCDLREKGDIDDFVFNLNKPVYRVQMPSSVGTPKISIYEAT